MNGKNTMDMIEPMFSDMGRVALTAAFIFAARAIDVSLGTLRLIFASRGYGKLAPLIGFFESLLWIAIIHQVMANTSNPVTAIAYAGGFATGTFTGIMVEKKLSLGDVLVRIIAPGSGRAISEVLREHGFAVTEINAGGRDGPVTLLFSLIPRRDYPSARDLIKGIPEDFIFSAEDVRMVQGTGRRWDMGGPPIPVTVPL